MNYTIPKGAYIRVELMNPLTFEMPDNTDQDAIELHATDAIRNNGEVVLTSTVTLQVATGRDGKTEASGV